MTENQKTYATVSDILSKVSTDVQGPSGMWYKIRALSAVDFLSMGQDLPMGDMAEDDNPDATKKAMEALPAERKLGFVSGVLCHGIVSMVVVDDRPSNEKEGVLNAKDIPTDDQLVLVEKIVAFTGLHMKNEGVDGPLPEGQRGDGPPDGA